MDRNGLSFEEYNEAIRQGLIDSAWGYTLEQADSHMSMEKQYIQSAYERGEPVDDVVAEVGFGCG